MTIESIDLWHTRARPQPTAEDFNVQLGCHFEEIVEMFDSLAFTFAASAQAGLAAKHLEILANMLKSGEARAKIYGRKDFLDSVADQVVTGVGVAHCAHMDGAEAIHRVNLSNWSKFDDEGMPIFNEHGKVAKGPKYAPPDLEGLY
jgi:hypothetical protein